ncbi:MAG: hypothetical protein ACLT8C_00540 [Akkermansia muciniphila]
MTLPPPRRWRLALILLLPPVPDTSCAHDSIQHSDGSCSPASGDRLENKGLRLASPCASSCRPACCCPGQPALDRAAKTWTCGCGTNRSTAGSQGAEEIQAILERHKHAGDRVRLVDFAQSAVLRGRGDPVFAGGTAGTDMEQALAYTMALMSPNRTNRILMLTDGWPTTPLDQAAEQLIQSRIPVDYRLSVTFREADIRIEQIRTPARIRPGEAFILEHPGRPPARHHRSWPSANGGLRWGNGYPAQRQSHGEAGGQALHPGCSAYEMTITPKTINASSCRQLP